ncbi:Alpha and gamma adaptin binding protein p34 [Phytophthora infestans]|uniref:Alpha and gamma adaptin binding protein p34 n=1 Tax=Phytophthora infestans TaxID=4787 RepID=A0A833VY35_PHYIN|nr:Alpha and gamma adaptin binding protein p34 [Phytophthora infestans]
MATEVSRLLVLGTDNDSNGAVISKLRALCGDEGANAAAPGVMLLNLQTKYYRALVELHVHHVRDNSPEPALQHELHDYEAIICVVDAGQCESFLHVQQLAKRIVDTLPYDVCLLAASTSSATTESTKKMETWCQDIGFEFVDLDAGNATSDDSVINEKLGIERVLEALQCNMWRSMEMNPPKVESAKETEVTEAAETDENQKKNKVNEQGDATDDTKLQALLQALEIAGDATVRGAAGEKGDDDDIDMAQFSALISEVRNVRDQGESLTDEQRRERAAEVAMKLWNLLGDDSDGDED